MLSLVTGYGIMFVFAIALFLLAYIFRQKLKKPIDIENYLLAGRKMPLGIMAPSILVSWTWTTTILGAAEAGVWYGIYGGIAYSIGATISFVVLIILFYKLRKIIPNAVSIVEFMGERYGNTINDIYFVLSTLVVVYISIEQAVGIGMVFNNIFGISFKASVFIAIMVPCLFTVIVGMRGVLYNDLLQFFITILCILSLLVIIIKVVDLELVYGELAIAKRDFAYNIHNFDIFIIGSKSGFRYAIAAVFIAMGQIFMEPGYYSKACASKDVDTFKWSFIWGGIAWMPIPIISALVFGYSAISMNISKTDNLNIPNAVLSNVLDSRVIIIFSILIFSIGLTTITNSLIGLQSIYTMSYYKQKILKSASENEQIIFGKTIAISIGFLCALIAISLEGISLLKIDIFSGIFFAAPCGALILGIYSKKTTQNHAVISIILGLIFGIGFWIYEINQKVDWFYGTLLSFIVPIIYLLITSIFCKREFDFNRLKLYK